MTSMLNFKSFVDERSAFWIDEENHHLFGNYQININGEGNDISIHKQKAVKRLGIEINGNRNSILIKDNNSLGNVSLQIRGNDSHISIGNRNNLRSCKASIGEGNSKINIGNDCLFSIGVEIRTHDSHKIIDIASNQRLNSPEDIVVSDRVWICQDVLLLKGAFLGSDAVVGVRSVVTGNVPPNTVVAGVPARVVRSGIRWIR